MVWQDLGLSGRGLDLSYRVCISIEYITGLVAIYTHKPEQRVCVYIYIYMYICMYIYIYIHTNIHI